MANAQRKAIEAALAYAGEGAPVRYIRGDFYPTTSHFTCLLGAGSAAAVARAHRMTGPPFERIEEVIGLLLA